VLAFAREGYTKARVDVADLWDVVSYRGFWKLAAKHGRMGAGEMWRSFSKAAFVRALQRLVPRLEAKDLAPAPAGVRAQALAPDGALVDDFLVHVDGRVVHVLNAPSPAATSSLSIGDAIVDRLSELASSDMP
jgi:L-2-hydroxyglutarate oxidase LhgO